MSVHSTSYALFRATISVSLFSYPKMPPSLAPVASSLSRAVLHLQATHPQQMAGKAPGEGMEVGAAARLLQRVRLAGWVGVADTGAGARTRPRDRGDVGAVDLVEGIEMMIGASHPRAGIRHLPRGEILGVTVATGDRRHARGVLREGEGDMIEACCYLHFLKHFPSCSAECYRYFSRCLYLLVMPLNARVLRAILQHVWKKTYRQQQNAIIAHI